MTKALSSFPESERFHVAKRREASKSGGLGYLAAKDAMEHFGKTKVVKVSHQEDADEVPEQNKL